MEPFWAVGTPTELGRGGGWGGWGLAGAGGGGVGGRLVRVQVVPSMTWSCDADVDVSGRRAT
ncbi:hypothetical protein Tdes44962_MAKER09812 [Teratosphaeria destructans]|uniref:Uncharacterized protein n=1 Tax=Teratosphaeria destructans TaxID=418781 RepID=A0A9W7W1S9_9PEZI|nr:hypothetical protein Tdes44962_MAKER09812 [Teratosphaeria destructans]